MRLVLRFALPLLCVLGIMAGVLTPVADSFIARWFQHDVEMRSRLIFTSVADSLTRLIHDASQQEIERLFDRIAEDERVLAVGWCSPNGQLQETSKAWLVNPPDARATADAIEAALRMSPAQQAERMHLMREFVSENNAYFWAGRMLLDASRIRKSGRIESSIAVASARDRVA